MSLSRIKRIILIVLDSVGIGELPDAADYGDVGSNTLKNVAEEAGGLFLPNLETMGLGLIEDIKGLRNDIIPKASFGKMLELSKGKDSTIGHWELSGIIEDSYFPVYPDGFSEEIIEEFKKATGLNVLGNIPASGTEIIQNLGEEHLRTGWPIIYTSCDSVFQIAAHEDVLPVKRLYEICQTARTILNRYRILRVIARPFSGTPGNFQRTKNRKDYSIPPPGNTILDIVKEAGHTVIGIGKVGDIFDHRGFSFTIPTSSNIDGMNKTIKQLKQMREGFILTNLIDFDMIWGHRNDVMGYARGLEEFDKSLFSVLQETTNGDMLIITADHGCDPTIPHTDHTREYVPLLVMNSSCPQGTNLGVRRTFADVGQTIASAFGVEPLDNGTSFLEEVLCPFSEKTLKGIPYPQKLVP